MPIAGNEAHKVRGSFRRGISAAFGDPRQAAGVPQIKRNWQAIRQLAVLIAQGPQPDPRVRVSVDRKLDVIEMAIAAGVTADTVEYRLEVRLKQTRQAVFCYMGAATLLWVGWFYEALTAPRAYAHPLAAIGLVAVTSCFALGAFYNALVNWQIRTRRLGTAREFLATTESWWPSQRSLARPVQQRERDRQAAPMLTSAPSAVGGLRKIRSTSRRPDRS